MPSASKPVLSRQHRVDLEREVVVRRQGRAGQKPQDSGLEAREAVVQAQHPAPQSRDFRRVLDQLPQGVDLRACELEASPRRRLVLETAHEGLHHIAHVHRRELRIRAGEGDDPRAHREKGGEAVEERVAGAEHHRGPQARGPHRIPRAAQDARFAFRLGGEVLAGTGPVRPQRAHVQEPRNSLLPAGTNQLFRQRDMRVVEAASARIQDTDEVDGRVAARKALAQGIRRVHVELDELAIRNHEQMAVPLASPRENARPVAGSGQGAHQVASDEAAAAEYRYASHLPPARASRSSRAA